MQDTRLLIAAPHDKGKLYLCKHETCVKTFLRVCDMLHPLLHFIPQSLTAGGKAIKNFAAVTPKMSHKYTTIIVVENIVNRALLVRSVLIVKRLCQCTLLGIITY